MSNSGKFSDYFKEYQISALTDCVAIFKYSLKTFADRYESNADELRRATQKLRNNYDTILNAEPVKIIVCNEGIRANILSYTFAFL